MKNCNFCDLAELGQKCVSRICEKTINIVTIWLPIKIEAIVKHLPLADVVFKPVDTDEAVIDAIETDKSDVALVLPKQKNIVFPFDIDVRRIIDSATNEVYRFVTKKARGRDARLFLIQCHLFESLPHRFSVI